MRPSRELRGPFGTHRIVDLAAATGGETRLARMPWCHRVLLENILRQSNPAMRTAGRDALLEWLATGRSQAEIPFAPSRILMHDTTCGPALVDIAAMRDALAEAGGDPELLNPVVPVASSVDHSVAVDIAGSPDALAHNMARDIERNTERYRFMKWAASALRGFRVFPPGTGIMHTINLERLSTVVSTEERDGVLWAVPDTLVGTDSHTPMVNSQPGEREHQVEVVGRVAVADEPVGLTVTAGGAAVHDLPALARLLHQPDRLHRLPALARPVAGQVVDVQRPQAERAVVAVVPVGVGRDVGRAVRADEAGVLRLPGACPHGRRQGTNGSMPTTSTVMSRPLGAW